MSESPLSAEEIFPSLIDALSDGMASVNTLVHSNTTIFQVSIPADHAGKLIGKNGSLAVALRRVLVGFSGRDNHCYRLEMT